jgi:chromosome segregation ATPase
MTEATDKIQQIKAQLFDTIERQGRLSDQWQQLQQQKQALYERLNELREEQQAEQTASDEASGAEG